MGTTSKNLWYPDSTDSVSPLQTVLGGMQTSVDAALDGQRWDTPAGVHVVPDAVGLATLIADLDALGYSVGVNNPIYAERSDTGLLYRNAGSGWVPVIPNAGTFPTVRYDAAQTLTLTEQGRARTNIAAASDADVTALENFQAANFGSLPWTSYTPTLTNVTLGTGGTVSAAWMAVGKQLTGYVTITLGVGGAFTSAPTFGIPVSCGGTPLITATARDNSTTARRVMGGLFASTTSISLIDAPTSAFVNTSVPWTWAEGDSLAISYVARIA